MSTLYEQVGGDSTVKTAVTVFYNRVTGDDALAPWFEGIDLSRLRAHQRAFLSMALDGPELFAGRDLAGAHTGLGITDAAFDVMIVHLLTSLADLGLDPAATAQVGQRLESLRPEVVTA